MNSENRKVKFILSWQTYSVGDVIEPNATLRDWLVNNGYCEPVDAVIKSPENRAILSVPRKRGRPPRNADGIH